MKCAKSAKPKAIQKFTSWLQKLLFCDNLVSGEWVLKKTKVIPLGDEFLRESEEKLIHQLELNGDHSPFFLV